TTANILVKQITAAGITAANKIYDGNRNATVSGGSLSQAIAGDDVTLTGATGLFDTKNAGTAKLVTISGGTLAGVDRNNYSLVGSGTTTADILVKQITAAGLTAANKIYDGNRNATVSGGSLSQIIVGDDVTLTGATGLFDTKNVGTEKLVTISGGTLAGVDRNNYSLVGSGTTTADILVKQITAAGLTAANKIYDGNRNATVSGGSLSQAIAGDDVTLTGATGLFDTKNVGTEKPVTISGGTLAGVDSNNYSLVGSGTTTADILVKQITAAGLTAADKIYDGNRNATVSG